MHHDAEGLTAWAEDTDGTLLAGVLAYRSGWLSFFPETEFFSVGTKAK